MSERTDRDFVQDIQEASRRIAEYTMGMSYEAFLADTKTQDAVVRNLEIIGEATKYLSEELRNQHSEIPWKSPGWSQGQVDSPLLRRQFRHCLANRYG